MKAKKSLGQNFLFDPSILKKIIQSANINKDDTIVEIGAGYGNLTLLLAEVSKSVIAIEYDEELFNILSEKVRAYDNIQPINCDALKFNFKELECFKVVGNIPYYITTPIIFKLLAARENIETITLTLQKEVAERIVAKPGKKDYGVLSLSVQYYSEPEMKFIIPAEAFRPAPKVDSAVIHLQILKKPRVSVVDEGLFFRLIKAGFAHRRKTILNTLKMFDADMKEILLTLGIETNRRAETLSMEDFGMLCNELYKKKRLRTK